MAAFVRFIVYSSIHIVDIVKPLMGTPLRYPSLYMSTCNIYNLNIFPTRHLSDVEREKPKLIYYCVL